MNGKRMMAVGLIFMAACAGWVVLGLATTLRSTNLFDRLGSQVENLWGSPLVQESPSVSVQIPGSEQVRWLMPSRNDIKIGLETDYRKKGLIWYPTYTCSFDGAYTVTNTESVTQKVRLHFNFPAKGATYDNFGFTVNGQAIRIPVDTKAGIGEIIELAPGDSREFRITYRTRGLRDWRYKMDSNVGRVQNLNMTVKTGFSDVDYTEGSLSPMTSQSEGQGLVLTWKASDLITSEDIGIVIPEKLNPGPLTSRITFFAPVCLIFFFILVGTINIIYKVDIHPMHYFFVAAGFFAFHLLLAYMAGMVNIHLAFMISAVTSVTLVTSYMTAALKGKFPWKIAVGGQLFFLVLFSYSFFMQGITGLTVAVGSVVTLAVLMKVTAHVDWNDVFSRDAAKKMPATPAAIPPALP